MREEDDLQETTAYQRCLRPITAHQENSMSSQTHDITNEAVLSVYELPNENIIIPKYNVYMYMYNKHTKKS